MSGHGCDGCNAEEIEALTRDVARLTKERDEARADLERESSRARAIRAVVAAQWATLMALVEFEYELPPWECTSDAEEDNPPLHMTMPAYLVAAAEKVGGVQCATDLIDGAA